MNYIKSIVLIFALMLSSVLTGQCNFTVSLGEDTIVCAANDSFKINAVVTPPGNYHYEWVELLNPQNVSYLSNTTTQEPVFNKNISQNTSFVFQLMVYDPIDNCTVSDTINIKVEKGYGMSLPSDTSICYDVFSDFDYTIDSSLTAVSWDGWAGAQGVSGNILHVFYDSLYMDSMGVNYLLSSVHLYDSLTKCEAEDSLYVYIDTCLLTVWPGDANNDNVVNMFDIFPVGIATLSDGPVRNLQNTSWVGSQAISWKQNFGNSLNYAFADCDGDGHINDHDIVIIENNYTLTHNKMHNNFDQPKFNQALPSLYCKFDKDTVFDESQIDLMISIGDSNQSVNNVYGLAFSLFFDPSYVADSSFIIDFKNDLFGGDKYTIQYEHAATGQLDIGIVKADQKDTTGFGDITGIKLILENVIAGSSLQTDSFSFSFGNVEIIDINYDTISVNVVNDTVKIIQSPITDYFESKINNNLKVFPNPAKEMFFISGNNIYDEKVSVRIYDPMGRLITSMENIVSWPVKITTSKWNSGIYIIDVQSRAYNEKQRLIIK